MNPWPYVIVGLIAAQRIAEVVHARRNTRALVGRGAVEVGAGHYPLIIVLHVAWLAAIIIALPAHARIGWAWIAGLVGLQLARLWVVVSLGPYWTTRIITLPGAPLVHTGPYRFTRHPAYLIVALEIAVLPLAFGEIWVAAAFSVLNAALLTWRMRQEDAALAARRGA